jgi:hypothetical protein
MVSEDDTTREQIKQAFAAIGGMPGGGGASGSSSGAAASVGPGGCCSPCHRVPLSARDQGAKSSNNRG